MDDDRAENTQGHSKSPEVIAKNEIGLVNQRIELFKRAFESPILDDKDRRALINDEECIAVFIGIKPCAWTNNDGREVIEKLLKEYQISHESDEAQYLLNKLGFTRSFFYNKKLLRERVLLYRNFLSIEDDVSDIDQFMKDFETDLGDKTINEAAILLGYPPHSVLNYEILERAERKIDEYFMQGRGVCKRDGWNDVDVQALNRQSASEAKREVLQKHQLTLGLSEDEIAAYSTETLFRAFGYRFRQIPEPKTQYYAKETRETEYLISRERLLKPFVDYLDKWRVKPKIHDGRASGSISISEMIWFRSIGPNDIRNLHLQTAEA